MINRVIRNKGPGFLLLLLILLILYVIGTPLAGSVNRGSIRDKPFFVQVEGDVQFPGVYGFPENPGLEEIMEISGRKHPDASAVHGIGTIAFPSGRCVVLRHDEKGYGFSERGMTAFYKVTLGIPLSLNHESEEGLTAAPGIGPGLARAIVKERIKRGGFGNLEEILTIKGVGENLLRKIRPSVGL